MENLFVECVFYAMNGYVCWHTHEYATINSRHQYIFHILNATFAWEQLHFTAPEI